MQRIGLISDTHGLVRPEALAFLRGCDRIVHAGDIGKPELLVALAALAPLTAVRGNNDKGAWAGDLPEHAQFRAGGLLIHVLHDVSELRNQSRPLEADVVICGHSHKPSIAEHAGMLFLNPGSAGPRRFKLPVCAAELVIGDDRVSVRIQELMAPGMIANLAWTPGLRSLS